MNIEDKNRAYAGEKTGILLSVVGLSLIGTISVMDMTMTNEFYRDLGAWHYIGRHIAFGAVGLVVMAMSQSWGPRVRKYATSFFCCAVVMSFLPLLPEPFGSDLHAWRRSTLLFGRPGIHLAPWTVLFALPFVAESAAMARSGTLSRRNTALLVSGLSLIFTALLFQPDLPRLFLVVVILAVFVRVLPLLMVPFIIGLAVVVIRTMAGDPQFYWTLRRSIWAYDHLADPFGYGWQASLALRDVGAGGMFGVGLGQLQESRAYHWPGLLTSGILQLVGKEWGVAGLAVVFSLMFLFLICGIRLLAKERDSFQRHLGSAMLLLIVVSFCASAIKTFNILPCMPQLHIPFLGLNSFASLAFFFAAGTIYSCSEQLKTDLWAA